MPSEGEYQMKQISATDYGINLKAALKQNKIISCITYKRNVELINSCFNVMIPLAKEQGTSKDKYKTIFEKGDECLIMKLKSRINPDTKGKNVQLSIDSYEFFCVTFK